MPHLTLFHGRHLAFLSLLAWAGTFGPLLRVQAEVFQHTVDCWYTSTQGNETFVYEAAVVTEFDDAPDVYEFVNVPKRGTPSGMQFRVNVDYSNIRIELTSPPTANDYTESLYFWFQWPMISYSLVKPSTLPTGVQLDRLPDDSLIEFLDPDALFSLTAELDLGALQLSFDTQQAANFPTVIELTYQLNIGETASPTSMPTLSPSTALPTADTLSPSLMPVDEDAAVALGLRWGAILTLCAALGLFFA